MPYYQAEIGKLRAELETAVERETFAIQEADNLRAEIEKWKFLQQHAVDIGVEQLEEIEKLKNSYRILQAERDAGLAEIASLKAELESLKAKYEEPEDDDGVKTRGFDY
jgi:chromosome segregation ATPase